MLFMSIFQTMGTLRIFILYYLIQHANGFAYDTIDAACYIRVMLCDRLLSLSKKNKLLLC